METYWFLSRDGDGHWFVIPTHRRNDWNEWRNLDEDNEQFNIVPDFAVPINGMPERVEFSLSIEQFNKFRNNGNFIK